MQPSDLKRRFKLIGQSRGAYKRIPRPAYSRVELVEFVRENKIKSRRQLLGMRSDLEPKPYDYIKEFGSWSATMEYIWHDGKAPTFDRHYVIMSVIEFGLWDSRSYQKAKSKRPDVLASMRKIKKEFGSWSVLTNMAKCFSLRETMSGYVELKEKLGKFPMVDECRKNKLDIDKAVSMFGSKKKLDEFIAMMEVI